ncbi:MAG TPA: TIGR01620 family protein [Alphaproteobacteria bacterium]|nr:TIGR01620 family protein [Alphaproteobacteria bacterium]
MTRARWADPETEFVLDEAQPTADRAIDLAAQPPVDRRPRPARRFLWALAVLLVALVGFELGTFIYARFQEHWAIGAGFALLTAAVVGCAVAWAAIEIRALGRLKSVDRARARLLAKNGEDASTETVRLIEEVSASLARRPSLVPALQRYQEEVQDTHEVPQRLALFSRTVLSVADREAYHAVGRAARDVGVLTAVVPTALADTAVLVWRNVRMVREVAEIYGYRAGPVGTWALIRRLLSGAALVAATDIAGGILAQQLGGALTEVVAAKLGGSAVATTRTLRLGLLAMQLCRAVPFGEDDIPSLRRFATAILAQLRAARSNADRA